MVILSNIFDKSSVPKLDKLESELNTIPVHNKIIVPLTIALVIACLLCFLYSLSILVILNVALFHVLLYHNFYRGRASGN